MSPTPQHLWSPSAPKRFRSAVVDDGGRILRQGGAIALILGLFLSGCAATSALDDRQLGKLLEAYRTESGAAGARQPQGASRGIRRLEVERAEPGQALRASVDLEDAPLAAVVPRLLTAAGVAYLFQGVTLYGTVTARFEGLPFGEALNLLLSTRRLVASLEQGVWIIRPAQGGAKEPGASAEPGRTSVKVALQHLDTKTAMELLNGLFPAKPTGRLVDFGAQPLTNAIILAGPAEEVARAAQMLAEADGETPHVIIEALVVAFNAETLERLGTDITQYVRGEISFSALFGGVPALTFGYLQGGITPQTTTGATSGGGDGGAVPTPTVAPGTRAFNAALDLLVSQDKARVISRPYLATVSGQTASINIATDRHIIIETREEGVVVSSTKAVSSGVKLTVLPMILADGTIRMQVTVEDAEFAPIVPPNVAVEVDRKSASTTMLVSSGQSVVIGGLTAKRQGRSLAGLPWLRHVPGLNLLFAKQQFSESEDKVVIYLTPHVWRPSMTAPLTNPDVLIGPERRLSPTERLGRE